MRAVDIPRPGGPEVLTIADRPIPEPRPNEVRVRVTAATVNPTDLGLRSGEYGELPDPATPGMELAGVVDAAGDGTPFAVGTRVFGAVGPSEPSGGAQAEYVVVPVDQLAESPAAATDVEIATLPMNGLTAKLALDALGLEHGQTLAVTGGAGAVGGYVIQLAVAAGLVVVADAKDEDVPLLQQLGAHHIVGRDGYRQAFPDGVDGLYDAAGISEKALPAVKDGGVMVSVKGFDGPSERGIEIRTFFVFEHLHNAAELEALAQRVIEGTLTLRVAATYPLEKVGEAQERLAAGGTRGRLVLVL